jgi:hypothetical protein
LMSTNKSDHHDSHKGLIKSTSILSLGTFSSRVLGFVRDICLRILFSIRNSSGVSKPLECLWSRFKSTSRSPSSISSPSHHSMAQGWSKVS